VTVSPGDSLWSISADRLSPDAADSDIDNAWRAWYSANIQVIGDNPDLILPGQQLLPPDPEMGR
jgi:nucleoid-associated protein YgaU